MSRGQNPIKSTTFTISTTPGVVQYLKDLIDKQVFGKTVPEVAEGLIREAIRRLQREDELGRRDFPKANVDASPERARGAPTAAQKQPPAATRQTRKHSR